MPRILVHDQRKKLSDLDALKKFGVYIKRKLEARGRTQSDLSKVTGIAPSVLSHILSGHNACRKSTIKKMLDKGFPFMPKEENSRLLQMIGMQQ